MQCGCLHVLAATVVDNPTLGTFHDCSVLSLFIVTETYGLKALLVAARPDNDCACPFRLPEAARD